MDNQEIICYCSNVTRSQILKAIDDGAKSLGDIRKLTKACTVGRCKEFNPRKRCCSPDILKIIRQYNNGIEK